ncbi:hypothetical protein TCON_0411 [Astathelohania contejeani]|uniref:Uncharacterized protein n=1 Tax=Astathelohania contejeani TaxID=164912 RepID=A0ABQ7I1V1_9MICR|nr:hypothetical protein TCON_0411 [Thelohania contejeani]
MVKSTPTYCSISGDVYIINVHIHSDPNVLDHLSRDISGSGHFLTHVEYFNDIFSTINKKLVAYGIRINPHYDQINLDDFHIPWGESGMSEYSPVNYKTQVCKEFFRDTSPKGVGNRILLFQHPNDTIVSIAKSSIQTEKECGNISGFLYKNPDDLRILLIDGILKMFSYGAYAVDMMSPDHFNIEICEYARKCVTKSNNREGEYYRKHNSWY